MAMHSPSIWLIWPPRVAGIAFVCFLSLFALDAFQGDAGMGEKTLDYLKHLTPAAVCALVVVLAWRREWLGAVGFLALAAFYTWMAWDHLDWVAVIAGPLVVIAVFYGLAWRARKRVATI